ncbi:MAG: histidine phosphatase family protein [Rubrivivax sp.]
MLRRRRRLLATLPALALPARADGDAAARLRAGGCVVAFRHALAPGTYDPPDMRLDDCRTQRNLSDEGRAQARRIGEMLRSQGLVPRRVRSSPWCRCRETAQLAFGTAEDWRALGSPRAGTEATHAASLAELRAELQRVSARRDGFEAWVTHMFVLQDLAGSGTASGEGLVLRAGPDGRVQLLGRIVTG